MRWSLALFHALKQRVSQPLEPILHPSIRRLRWIGIFITIGYPLFWVIWTKWLVQPWDSFELRIGCALLGLLFLVGPMPKYLGSLISDIIFVLLTWLLLPLFFTYLYLKNQENSAWLSSYCAMLLIYYYLVDWRIATIGVLLAGFLVVYFYQLEYINYHFLENEKSIENLVAIGFAWCSAFALGFSSANLRTEQLKNSTMTMGVLAHELRTPIASIALIAHALHSLSSTPSDQLQAENAKTKLMFMSNRLSSIVHTMTNHIDTQIANARHSSQSITFEWVHAAQLLAATLDQYPYSNDAQRHCIKISVEEDFKFFGILAWSQQILNNLIKNSLYALAAKEVKNQPNDILITVKKLNENTGLIVLTDKGIGMHPKQQKNIFQPFYSSNRNPSCRIPDDCIDSKRYPLFMAREVMRGAIQEFQSTGG
jgi:two-component system, CAI-1 autoinducer sensor kinase/phosphatase CqsS